MDPSTQEEVRKAIQQAKAQGKTDEEIKGLMRQAGYSEGELNEAFSPESQETEKSPEKSESQSLACPKCGMANSPGSRFCKGCGTQLSSDSRPQPAAAAPASQPAPTPAPPPRPIQSSGHSNKNKLIVIAIIIVAALSTAFVLFTMFDPATNARAECEAEIKKEVMDRYGLTEQELMAGGRYTEMIYDEDDINDCVAEKALTKRDPTICMSLPQGIGSSDQEECLEDIIDETYVASACQYLSGENRVDCYEYISCNTGDYSICDNLPTFDNQRSYCKDPSRYCSSGFYL
jgi:hypothetical protein